MGCGAEDQQRDRMGTCAAGTAKLLGRVFDPTAQFDPISICCTPVCQASYWARGSEMSKVRHCLPNLGEGPVEGRRDHAIQE